MLKNNNDEPAAAIAMVSRGARDTSRFVSQRSIKQMAGVKNTTPFLQTARDTLHFVSQRSNETDGRCREYISFLRGKLRPAYKSTLFSGQVHPFNLSETLPSNLLT
ncbi:hypothetical protein E1B28_006635 [Marasmius oreades]|uniref:Uncharacterized protein n=1 Tax=Marasmius oreades TaxID=181124 RepID=A0A9P8A9K3_9AGAR|nr:uncharacterized protein E1B28_006635 [Marasmius oreades]KAG7095951.1 hypothetical protein E1B28_006635 [Marasmius oreades]